MSNKTKKPVYLSGLYITLSLCVLAVVVFGAYSAVNELFAQNKTQQSPDNSLLDDLNKPTDFPQYDESIDLPIDTPNENTSDTETEEVPKKDNTEASTQTNVPERVFVAPVKTRRISKEFSTDELIFSTTMNDYRAHTGVDFACEVGTAVYALTDGVVESIHADPLMGQTVILDHGDGLKSVYQNLALEIPQGIVAGIEIDAGELIGAVGNTAIVECAEEDHLHFEVLQNGVPTNPGEYVK